MFLITHESCLIFFFFSPSLRISLLIIIKSLFKSIHCWMNPLLWKFVLNFSKIFPVLKKKIVPCELVNFVSIDTEFFSLYFFPVWYVSNKFRGKRVIQSFYNTNLLLKNFWIKWFLNSLLHIEWTTKNKATFCWFFLGKNSTNFKIVSEKKERKFNSSWPSILNPNNF